MENSKLQYFKDQLSNTTDRDLCNLICELNSLRKMEDNTFLKNWQKVCLINATASFYIGWFKLCRSDIDNALESIENISLEPFNINKINTSASSLTDDELDSDIQYICSNGPRLRN